MGRDMFLRPKYASKIKDLPKTQIWTHVRLSPACTASPPPAMDIPTHTFCALVLLLARRAASSASAAEPGREEERRETLLDREDRAGRTVDKGSLEGYL